MNIRWKVTAGVAAAFVAGLAGGVTYAKQARPEYSLVPAGTAKFAPVDPKNPAGAQAALLSGDPKTGPYAFLLKLPKGILPNHWHSSDYYSVTLEGVSKHWVQGKQAEATSNPPGTFWFQPGGITGIHGDECLSDTCVDFIFMPGKFDVTPAADKAGKP